MADEFVNWSESLRFTPERAARPSDEEEVVELVRRARERGGSVRPVGRGHSSMPLVQTGDTLMSLEHLSGLIDHDTAAGRATVGAGTDLSDLGPALEEVGLAMENLGDVDFQTIAGAVGTGTHGSGTRFGNLSTQVVGMRLVTGTGDVVECSEDERPDLLRAARVSLGALGVATSMTLRLLPMYELRRRSWCSHIDWTLANLEEMWHAHRNIDFYWYPRSDHAQIRTSDLVGDEAGLHPPGELRSDVVGPAHEVLPQERDLQYEEIEYMLPVEAFEECFAELRARIKDHHRKEVGWRVLVRTVAADDSMISSCYGRDTVTIACLHNNTLPYDRYFSDVEPILVAHGGRPHYGKKHTRTAADLRPHFPEWDDFMRLRAELDPDGVLLNDHLRALLLDEESQETAA